LAAGYVSELCLLIEPWIASLAACLAGGALLLFDYGLPRAQYYHPERRGGTLTCHFKHRAHFDPLLNLGVQDITAWVDFTRVALAGLGAGLDVLGFATQAGFLLGAGIDALLAEAQGVTQQARLAGEARRLLMPGEMGEAFKLLALGRDITVPLIGFRHQDLRDSL
jgi:SAM-dependent MidA family methyltransferase